jgi:hypothetical protein
MEEAVEHRRDRGVVAEQFAPIFNGPVRCQDGAGLFVTTHDELEEIFRAVGGSLRIPMSSMINKSTEVRSAM